ncbi:DUF2690 domain-containing protein [Actinoplanes sp. HUAS TT8]|uniref:DUF2690 domain-containing protein n=1 Tax=Actinoplanes sp. HUAS TT8 TaxID=3447453 RepID=UPI003F51F227
MKVASALATATLAIGALLSQGWTDGPHAATAPWAPHCDDGQRSTAANWAATGQFVTARVVTWVDGTGFNRVELRYNSAARCAWARYNGGQPAEVYLDRSTDGGAHWVGPKGSSGPARSAYTGAYNDYRPNVARACADYRGRPHCTDWY